MRGSPVPLLKNLIAYISWIRLPIFLLNLFYEINEVVIKENRMCTASEKERVEWYRGLSCKIMKT